MRDHYGGSKFSTFLFIAVLLTLLVILYFVVGGDFRFWQYWSSYGGGDPIGGILNGLRSVGDGISRSFSSLLH